MVRFWLIASLFTAAGSWSSSGLTGLIDLAAGQALALTHRHRRPAAPGLFQPVMQRLIEKILLPEVWMYWRDVSRGGSHMSSRCNRNYDCAYLITPDGQYADHFPDALLAPDLAARLQVHLR